uniref:Dysbindin domain-containing protein 1 n=1 Tax=Sinocyclocheilus rhinocerous TaxID=307959 RepID=A0A673IR40_9TELE
MKEGILFEPQKDLNAHHQTKWRILRYDWSERLSIKLALHSAIFCLISEPLSSVSSLEVHFDLLDLTELTDMSDQELGEVFADSDEENHTESPANRQQPPLPRFPHSGYVRSPSWTRGGKGEQQPRDRKHHSDSENTEPMLKIERSQSQQP